MAGMRKGAEQRPRHRVLGRAVFRMPLHPDDKAGLGHLDGLDDAVGILRADDESVAKPVDGLMVIALGI